MAGEASGEGEKTDEGASKVNLELNMDDEVTEDGSF